MSESPNKLIRFWQELKRRKVFKVIAMYAGTAFIILEVINNLVSPLRLPEWTPTLVVVLLAIGLPFAIIFSWIFDITPEGIKKTESIEASAKTKSHVAPVKRRLKASDIIIACLIVIVAILAYPKIFQRNTLEKLRSSGERISVAVMPFQNMTNDTIWNVWQDGIQNELITSLTNSEELKVRQTESTNNLIQSKGLTNYASITPSIASTISQKLDANIFIYGSIKQVGKTIRINAQLIDSKTEDTFKSFQINGTAVNILNAIDSLSMIINNFLQVTKLGKELSPEFQPLASTNSPEAYRYLIYGDNAFYKQDYPTAEQYYLQAVAIDSNFFVAVIKLAFTYDNQGLFDQAKKWCMRAYRKRDQMTLQQKIFANYAYAGLFETPYEVIKYLKQALEFDDQVPVVHQSIGYSYDLLHQYDKAIPELEKALKIYDNWDSKPIWVYNYIELGNAYHKTGKYKKEKKLYKKAEQVFPDDPVLLYNQAVLALSEGSIVKANHFIDKYISIRKENSVSEARIMDGVAGIYSQAGIMDKAEEYYLNVLSLEPENPIRLNNLAWFLIDKDRNINEGMELIDKALKLSPDGYYMLDTKGWGLYKQGKYNEALEMLQKSWELKPEYDHEIFLHLEAAKKAVAGLK